jgi:hypothetical protein
MNAILPSDAAGSDRGWEDACRSVNAWRGRGLHCFAQAESAVSETLLVLAADAERGKKVKLRGLIGQRFEDLAAAVGANGPFGAEGSSTARALSAFREHEALRPFLGHGLVKIALDRHNQWVILIKLLSFRGGKAIRSSLALDQREGAALLTELKARTEALASALHSLRARVGNCMKSGNRS